MSRPPVEADFFEDFIDGYFPLSQSLHHLIDRQKVDAALVILRVAPMMDIPGLAPQDPVPLHINPTHAGQIDWLAVMVERNAGDVRISGQAQWAWNDTRRHTQDYLSSSVRLAEPAFVRGLNVRDASQDAPDSDLDPVILLRDDNDNYSKSIAFPVSNSGVIKKLSEAYDPMECLQKPTTWPESTLNSNTNHSLAQKFLSDFCHTGN